MQRSLEKGVLVLDKGHSACAMFLPLMLPKAVRAAVERWPVLVELVIQVLVQDLNGQYWLSWSFKSWTKLGSNGLDGSQYDG